MTYNPGQVREIFPYVPEGVKWFVLGGPMLGDEAQVFKERFPNCQVVGFEPNPVAYDYQVENGFPGVLSRTALWDSTCEVQFKASSSGESSNGYVLGVAPWSKARDKVTDTVTVQAMPLDSWSWLLEPVENIVLWLDVEGSEFRALRGAERLLREGRIVLINVELYYGPDWQTSLYDNEGIHSYLSSLGYGVIYRWNGATVSDGMRYDVVYKRSPYEGR